MTTTYDIATYVLHGVADRDPNELVCMWFPTLQEAQRFPEQLPGRYAIQMANYGVDYDALDIETIDRIGGESSEPVDQAIVITGNPVDGLTFLGPFQDAATANEWADLMDVEPEWWVATLLAPLDDSEGQDHESYPDDQDHESDAPLVHKAEPWDSHSNCRHCGDAVMQVPGGHGPTWVHTATGAVAGSGAPSC